MTILKNMKIRSKIILSLLIVGLIPMLVEAFFGYQLANNQMSAEVKSKLRLYHVQKQETLKEWFNQQTNTAQIMATSHDIYSSLGIYYSSQGGGPWLIQNEMVVYPFCENAKNKSGYTEVFLTDDQGIIISASNRMLMNADLAKEAYLQQALQGKVGYSPIFFSDIAKQAIFIVTVPVLSEGTRGNVVGTLGCFLDVNKISHKVISGLDLIGRTADAFLINENLEYLSLPRATKKLELLKSTFNFSSSEVVRNAIRNHDQKFHLQSTYKDLNGKRFFMDLSILTLGDHSYGFISWMEEFEIFASLYNYSMFVMILVILCIVIVVIAGVQVSNILANPIRNIAQALKKVASGDLTVRVKEIDGKDELAESIRELNSMIFHLSKLISDIIASTKMVEVASTQLSNGNEDLSQRTQEQASTLEEVAATMEQITGTVAHTTSFSKNAEKISHSTLEAVATGEKSVKTTYDAIKLIAESSAKITEIIKTVNDITFQTNMLSLNAAVEAVRAGESGRGFAVVAAEIRALASKTAEYSKEIDKIINDDIELVQRGHHQVQESNQQLQIIVQNARENNDVTKEVSAALKEIMLAFSQIQAALEQLNQVTQQNATMVEEIASSSRSLRNEAENLSGMVSKFRVK